MLNDLVKTVQSTNRLIFYVLIYLFVKSFIYPTFTSKPTCVSVFCWARLQQLSKNSSKSSEQTWHWLSLSRFALLIRNMHSLRNGLFYKGSRWNLIPPLESLGVLFEQPPPGPSCIWWCCLLEICASRAQWRHAMRPSLQHGFQNGGRSNCSGAEH